MRTSFVCFFTVILLYTGAARAQSNLVLLSSQSGDYIGQGQTYVTTNSASFSLSGIPGTVSVSAFGYNIQIDGPGSTDLTVGKYSNAARYPFNGSSPGLTVSGNGRGCNTVCGDFEILELHTNGAGQVDRFWATFTHVCECFMAPLTGEIRYNSALAPATPLPKTLLVPAQYSTIQAALDSSSLLASDLVLVSAGTYNEAVNFKGKRTRLVSASGPGVTFIRAPGSAGVTFGSGETSEAVVNGFTITNCSTGIAVSSSSPTILSNVIVNCGTGIDCYFASPTIRANRIIGNSGDGVHLGGAATPTLENNVIQSNSTGISMFAAGSPLIRNNIIQSNRSDGLNMLNQSDADIIQNVISANSGSGIYWLVPSGARGPFVVNNSITRNTGPGINADGYDASARIVNNILLGAPALSVGGFNDNHPPIIQFNNIYSATGSAYSGLITNLTGVAGNISADPLFACVPGDDYHLLRESPCIDAGTDGAPQLPANDLSGTVRILDGDTNGVVVVDMGAFELNPAALPSPCLYITCPPNLVVAAAVGQNSAVVNYAAPTGTPVAVISSAPPSGSVFPGGTNTVICTATYGTNSVDCSFTITVLVPPTIAIQPQNTNVFAGQTFSLRAGATGSSPLSYRWTFEGNVINGATNETLSISNAQFANEGVYRAIVTNTVGFATSASAFVRVFPSAPTLISNPVSLRLPASANATFTVAAGGSQPLSYQWLFNAAPIPGATASQYSLTNIQSSHAGNYQVVVTNGLGSVTSEIATLTVTSLAPYFVIDPIGATQAFGSNHTFTGLAQGSEPLSYQWQRDGIKLPDAIQPSLTLSNLSQNEIGGYSLVASNLSGTSTSLVAQLVIYQSPTLQQPLTNQVVDAGSSVLLAVSANAIPAPGFAWQFNGAAMAGTNAVLTLTNIQRTQSGYYRVTITNQYGSISSTGRVSVLGPQSLVVSWGDDSGNQTNVPAGLNDVVAVSGGDYHSLALRHNGSLIAWGYNGDGQIAAPTNSLRFVSIASGGNHNLAVTETGSVAAWGRNDFGQCNVPAAASNNVLAVAAGNSHSSALLASGKIVSWGDNSFGQVSGSANLTSIRAIASGRNHGLALRSNGTVAGWGYNAYGQASPPQSLTGVSAIAAGYLHSVALRSNGTVVVWGDNTYSQTNVPPGLNGVIAIAAGDFHTFALRTDGSIVGWGDGSYDQTDIPTLPTNIVAVASGYYHGLTLVSVPFLHLRSLAGGFVIEWSGEGILQWAPTPVGPYYDLPEMSQSFTNFDFSPPARFYRLRR